MDWDRCGHHRARGRAVHDMHGVSALKTWRPRPNDLMTRRGADQRSRRGQGAAGHIPRVRDQVFQGGDNHQHRRVGHCITCPLVGRGPGGAVAFRPNARSGGGGGSVRPR